MYFSDDSFSYETTASQDERIEEKRQQEREEEATMRDLLESERERTFEEEFQEKTHEIFNLPGLTFLKFTHEKIKFSFQPSEVVSVVRKNVKFYCSLKYYKKYQIWNIRRDSFPANYKNETVAHTIFRIYIQLKLWAQEEEEFRMEKFSRYQNGEDVVLDSDDEELFLTEDERKQLQEKRMKVLKRMIPPPEAKTWVLPPEPKKKKRKLVPREQTFEETEEGSLEYLPKKRRRRKRRLI